MPRLRGVKARATETPPFPLPEPTGGASGCLKGSLQDGGREPGSAILPLLQKLGTQLQNHARQLDCKANSRRTPLGSKGGEEQLSLRGAKSWLQGTLLDTTNQRRYRGRGGLPSISSKITRPTEPYRAQENKSGWGARPGSAAPCNWGRAGQAPASRRRTRPPGGLRPSARKVI